MKRIKTVGIVLGALCVATVLVIGILLSVPPKMVDFRGEVTEIAVKDDTYVFHIVQESAASYVVIANNRTNVYRESDPKQDLFLQDVQVGDIIEGNYRRFSDGEVAKFIRIWG